MKKHLPLVTILLSVLLLTSFLFWKSYDLRRGDENILGLRHHREGSTNVIAPTDYDSVQQDNDQIDTTTEYELKQEEDGMENHPLTQASPTPEPQEQNIGSPSDTRQEPEFRLIVKPENVKLRPLQEQRFEAYVEMSDGQERKAEDAYLNWGVVNGGGTINQDGVFQAWDSPGTYQIRAVYKDKNTSVTVRIELEPVAQVTTTQDTTTSIINTTPLEEELEQEVPALAEETVISKPSPVSTRRRHVDQPTGAPDKKKVVEKPEHSFRYVEDNMKQCLQFVLGKEGYKSYFDPQGEHLDLGELKEGKSAIDRCFKISREPDFDSETKKCLEERLGEDRYKWITGQIASPTRRELYAASGCFTEPRYVTYKPQEEVSEFTQTCLEVKFGRERYQELVKKQANPTNEELAKGRECFNIEENIARPPLIVEDTDEQTGCLKRVLGGQRYDEIYNQDKSPSESETAAAKACFETAEDTQEVFLPPPPEQVAFIPESKQDSKIETIDVKVQETRAVVQLHGKAAPNSTVDIYIFSEPIVVTTQTDANGDWFYELSYHLPEGEHKAYAVVHHPEKGLVKSEVFAFNVALAAESVEGEEGPVPQIEVVKSARRDLTRVYLWIALIIVNLGGASLIGLQIVHLNNRDLS